jgi:hypothetical protein
VVATTSGEHLRQTGDVGLTFTVFEYVKEATIENSVEMLTEIIKAKSVRDDEPRIDSSFVRLPLSQLYGSLRHIDSDGFVPK